MTEAPELPNAHDATPRQLTMLIWDAPNIDMELSRLIGGRPTRAQRPEAGPLGEWLLDQTAGEISATVFVNVTRDEDIDAKKRWLHHLKQSGFDVYPKPKYQDDDDVDEAMVAAINEHRSQLARLVLMSHDRERFAPLVEELLGEGVDVSPLVLCDLDRWPAGCTPVHLYDLPGVVKERPVQFTDFNSLPREGVLLKSPRPLNERRRDRGMSDRNAPERPAERRETLPFGEPAQLISIVREVLHTVVGPEPTTLAALGGHIHRAFDAADIRTDEKVSVLVAAAIEGEPFVIDLADNRHTVRRSTDPELRVA